MNGKNFSISKTYFFQDYEDYFDIEPNGFEDCIFECERLEMDLECVIFRNKHTDKVLEFNLNDDFLDSFIEVIPDIRSTRTNCPLCFERDLVVMDYYAYDPWLDEDLYKIETNVI